MEGAWFWKAPITVGLFSKLYASNEKVSSGVPTPSAIPNKKFKLSDQLLFILDV